MHNINTHLLYTSSIQYHTDITIKIELTFQKLLTVQEILHYNSYTIDGSIYRRRFKEFIL